ncbi:MULTISPECIES: transposase [Rhodomicrobium]|uniref:transposase n=1 Tax=Rhodomicrobium vannielii TaxID=1069 RepID=UPI000B4B26F1
MSDGFDIKLKRKLERSAEDAAGHVSAVRRIELITGAARRRRWSSDEKARIVMESLRPGANVSEVARRNGLSPQQLFAWRREAHALFREGAGTTPADRPATAPVRQPRRRKEQRAKPPEIGAGTPMFAPVVIAASAPSSSPSSSPPATANAGRIEIAIGDAVVRVLGQVETAMLIAVLRAVRRSS